MASIYIIRHGQASFGAANYDELSSLGRKQAALLGGYLKKCGIALDHIYSGDLERQKDTALIAREQFGHDCVHTIDPRFNEVPNDEMTSAFIEQASHASDAIAQITKEGPKSSKDYQKIIEAVFNIWVSTKETVEDLQSWDAYSNAVKKAVQEVMSKHGSGTDIGIFTSGGTIATIMAYILKLSGDRIYSFYEPVMNCSVTRVLYSSQKASLSYFNDTSFLALEGKEYLTYR